MKKSRKKKQNAQPEQKRNIAPLDLEPPKRYYFNDEVASSFNTPAADKPKNKNEIRRRQNKKRKLKRGVRNVLITACVVLGVAVIGAVLSLTVFFNIASVHIAGSGTYSEEQIEQLCDINIGDNMFLIDKDKCKEKLTTALPYVYDVTIKRKLPDTVSIEITEAQPAYMIKNDDKTYTLLDDHLKVLENASKDKYDGAVTISNAIPVSNEPGHTVEFENEDTTPIVENDTKETVQEKIQE
ncbi:MAG: FtsQ-type POTRA domain-containing protein, partial [Eubacterium sp.]|nr:FtsQ-type POTRA domain-containing protein [Eubacterium sp.]